MGPQGTSESGSNTAAGVGMEGMRGWEEPTSPKLATFVEPGEALQGEALRGGGRQEGLASIREGSSGQPRRH